MIWHCRHSWQRLLETTAIVALLLFSIIPSTASFLVPTAIQQKKSWKQQHLQSSEKSSPSSSTALSFFFAGDGGDNSTGTSATNSYDGKMTEPFPSTNTAVSAVKLPWSTPSPDPGGNGNGSLGENQQRALEAAEEVLINLRIEMVEQDKKIETMVETLEQKTTTIEKLQQSLQSRDDILQRAFVTVENLETQNEKFTTQLKDLEEQTRTLQNENKAKEQQLQRTLKTLEEATAQIQILQKELVQVKEQQQQGLQLPKLELPKKEQIPLLSDWEISYIGEVTGVVTNHPRIPDGETIVTSPLENPKLAARNKVVETASGSKYKLGRKAPEKTKGAVKTSTTQEASASPTQITMAPDIPLTGEVAGDGKYLLAGKPKASKNGRSLLYAAYKSDPDDPLKPKGDALAIKISSNLEAMEREYNNYQKVSKSRNGGISFIERVEFLPVAGRARPTDRLKLSKKSALIMELGKEDLKEYIGRHGEGLQGQALQDAALAALQCLEGLHGANLVWTDLKTENFVITAENVEENRITVKGIDLESAVKIKGNPVDYTPEACPPEFAEAFLVGEGIDFVLEYSYDAWSFGMLLYELSTGRGFFDGKTAVQITKLLPSFKPNFDGVDLDPTVSDLISKCLQPDPKKRISIAGIRKHPFFAAANSNPFNFLFG